MENAREIIGKDPQAKHRKYQEKYSGQAVIPFRNGMGHIVNDYQEQQYTGKDNQ